MKRRFKILNTTDGEHIGKFYEFYTPIKTHNDVDFLDEPLRTTMFDGLRIRLVAGDYEVEGILK